MNTKPKLKTVRVELRLAPNQKEALKQLVEEDFEVETMSALIIKALNLPEAAE